MTLNKLSPSQRKRGRWLCQLSDGSLLKVSESDVAALGLYSGMELDDVALSALKQAAERSKTRETALNLLTARPLSRRELERKLEQRSAPEEEASSAADWLEDLGAIDDAAYARLVARHYGDRGYGPGRIREELRRRGVPREFWDGALAELPDSGKAIAAYLQKKCRGAALDEGERRRLADALRRRGFAWEDVQSALERLERG